MTPDEMMREGDKLYSQGSPGGAREWYAAAFAKLEILTSNRIEALEKRNAELAHNLEQLSLSHAHLYESLAQAKAQLGRLP